MTNNLKEALNEKQDKADILIQLKKDIERISIRTAHKPKRKSTRRKKNKPQSEGNEQKRPH